MKYREKQASKKTGDNRAQSNDESPHEMETRSRHGEVGLLPSCGVFLTIATFFFSLSAAFSLSAPASAAPPPHPPAPTLPPVPLSHSNQLRETRHRQLYPFSCCRLLFFFFSPFHRQKFAPFIDVINRVKGWLISGISQNQTLPTNPPRNDFKY